MGCRETPALSSGAPSPFPSSLVLAELYLTLFSSLCSIVLFLKHVFTEMPPALLMVSAAPYGGSIVETVPAVSGMGQPLVSSHRGHPRKQPLATATQHSQAVRG